MANAPRSRLSASWATAFSSGFSPIMPSAASGAVAATTERPGASSLLVGEGEFHAQSVTSLLHDSLLEWDRAD